MKVVSINLDCKELDENAKYVQIFKKKGESLELISRERLKRRKTTSFSVEIDEEEKIVLAFEPAHESDIPLYLVHNLAGSMVSLLPRISKVFCFIDAFYHWSLKTELDCRNIDQFELKFKETPNVKKPICAIVAGNETCRNYVKLSSDGIDFQKDFKKFNLILFASFAIEIVFLLVLLLMNHFDSRERFTLFCWVLAIGSPVFLIKVFIGSFVEYLTLKKNNWDLTVFMEKVDDENTHQQ